jgi:hypothetical protein
MKIAELLMKGCSEREIAAMLHKAASTIHYHSKALQNQWQEAMIQHRNRWLAEALAKLDRLEEMAVDEFELSRQRVTETAKGRGIGLLSGRRPRQVKVSNMIEIERSHREEHRAADPAYLQTVQWCIAQRNKLLGLYVEGGGNPFLIEREPPPATKYEAVRERLRAQVDAEKGEGES